MKKKIIAFLVAGISSVFLLTGCGVFWNYADAITHIDNKYFKTKVISNEGAGAIIENEITGEKFLVIAGTYGVSITPIKEVEDED